MWPPGDASSALTALDCATLLVDQPGPEHTQELVVQGSSAANLFVVSSTPSLIIRPAGLAEAGEVARIRVHSWQQGYPGLVPQGVLDAMSVEQDTERTKLRMTDPMLKVGEDWLVWRGDECLGWLGTGPCGDSDLVEHGVGEVLALYVLPTAWGRGVGHVLMEFAASRFLGLGYRMSVAWVMEGNARAERFYERQGYDLDGARRPLRMQGIPGHLRRMARQL